MNRRQLFLSTAKAALATAFGGLFPAAEPKAQTSGSAPAATPAGVIEGDPTRATGTINIDGRYLPPTPQAFGGVIRESARGSKPWWPRRVVPPAGAPNVILIMTDDQGYGVSSTFGGIIPTPALDRVANAGVRYTGFNSTALCSPTRPALITGRNHHSVGFGVITELSTGFPGYDSYIGAECATVGRILAEHGYATSWFGKNHNTPAFQYSLAGPFDQWPSGMGFEYFYGFMGGETDQSTPYLFRDHTQIFPWLDKPGYNLTTDMADEAIKYLNQLNAAAPEKPFFLYYAPGGSHSPHHPTKEWVDKFKGKFDMGWNAMRDQIFANQKRLGVAPADAELTPWPDDLQKWETLSADEKKLFARQAEVYAAYTAYTDHEIGRVIQAVEDLGKLEMPAGGGEGVIVTNGGRFGGYELYLLKGKPVFVYNFLLLAHFRWEGQQPLASGNHTIVFDFTYDGPGIGKGGTGVLQVDGQTVATRKIPHTIAFLQVVDETFDVGLDTRTPVSDDYQVPFRFNGAIRKVTFKLGPLQFAGDDRMRMQYAYAIAND
jgi:hypothetical protein